MFASAYSLTRAMTTITGTIPWDGRASLLRHRTRQDSPHPESASELRKEGYLPEAGLAILMGLSRPHIHKQLAGILLRSTKQSRTTLLPFFPSSPLHFRFRRCFLARTTSTIAFAPQLPPFIHNYFFYSCLELASGWRFAPITAECWLCSILVCSPLQVLSVRRLQLCVRAWLRNTRLRKLVMGVFGAARRRNAREVSDHCWCGVCWHNLPSGSRYVTACRWTGLTLLLLVLLRKD